MSEKPLKKIHGFCRAIRSGYIKAEYGNDLTGTKLKQVYKDHRGMYIKEGKKNIRLTTEEEKYVKDNYDVEVVY